MRGFLVQQLVIRSRPPYPMMTIEQIRAYIAAVDAERQKHAAKQPDP